MQPVITILGPTASGKTKLAVQIAKQINAEIISADSRQIYKYMDIGTGKDLNEYNDGNNIIPYHLIDILEPDINYSVYDFQKDCIKSINIISKNNKIPIICGGTGLYLESFLLNYKIHNAKPDTQLREQLETKSQIDLINIFKSLGNQYNPKYHNTKRRIIRGIEIISQNKNNNLDMKNTTANTKFFHLILGINIDRSKLLNHIKARLKFRLENGLIQEVENLIAKKNVSITRLKYFGLEYKFVAMYLNKEITYNDLCNNLNVAINQFSKKQMTFFRRMEKRGLNIHWVNPESNDVYALVTSFLAP